MYKNIFTLASILVFSQFGCAEQSSVCESTVSDPTPFTTSPPLSLNGIWTDAGENGGNAYRLKFLARAGHAYHFGAGVGDGLDLRTVSLYGKPTDDKTTAKLFLVRSDNVTGETTEIANTEMVPVTGGNEHGFFIEIDPLPLDRGLFNYRLDLVVSGDPATSGLRLSGPPIVAYAVTSSL